MAKARGASQQASGSRHWGPLLLAIAWLLLIAGVGGVGLWNNFLAAPPDEPPAEPFFVGLEPEPEPEPPAQAADAGALPPLPGSTEVPQVDSSPPADTGLASPAG